MILTFAGGVLSDEAPVAAREFVLWSENIRWVNGRPETIDLHTPMPDMNNDPVNIPIQDNTEVTVWSDRLSVFIGAGKTVWEYNWDSRLVTTYDMPDAAPTGRWWFVSTEKEIICARSSLAGRVHILDRGTQVMEILHNSPVGAIAGGIIGGVLTLAGTTNFGGVADPLTVRWSSRRGDPPTEDGDAAFNDWIPTDINSAGEILLDGGVTIVGGGATSYGFVVWTDKTMYMLAARDDSLVYSQNKVSKRGLLVSGTWAEMDNEIWFYDNSKVLNVYDGGAPRRLVNPTHMATTETMSTDLIDAVMVANNEYNEVLLHYTDTEGDRRQIVYNRVGGEWYPFALDRWSSADRQGVHPAVGISLTGDIYAQALSEQMDRDYLYPTGYPHTPMGSVSSGGAGSQGGVVGEIEPFKFMLSTNMMTEPNPLQDGPRKLNVVLATTYARPINLLPPEGIDSITVLLETRDKAARDGSIVTQQTEQFNIGTEGEDFRVGGKTLRVAIWGEDMRTFVRFGDMVIDDNKGARR